MSKTIKKIIIHIFWFILLFLFSQLPTFLLAVFMLKERSDSALGIMTVILVTLLALGLSLWIARKKQISDLSRPLFTKRNLIIMFLSYLGMMACMMFFGSMLVEETTTNQEVSDILIHTQNPFVMIILIVIAAPIMEELVFRGAMIKFFFDKPKWRWVGLVVGACIFGGMHMAGGFQLTSFMLYSSMGFMLGVPYVLTGRIELGILMHAFNNFLSFISS